MALPQPAATKELAYETQTERFARARADTAAAADQLVAALGQIPRARTATGSASVSSGASGRSMAARAVVTDQAVEDMVASSAWLPYPPLDLTLKRSLRVTAPRPFAWLPKARSNEAKARGVSGFSRCDLLPVAVGERSTPLPEDLAEACYQSLCYHTYPTTPVYRVRARKRGVRETERGGGRERDKKKRRTGTERDVKRKRGTNREEQIEGDRARGREIQIEVDRVREERRGLGK